MKTVEASEDAAAVAAAFQATLRATGGLIGRLPVGVYTCDLEGRIVQYNARAAEIWGRTPTPGDSAQLFCGVHKAFAPDGAEVALDQSPTAQVLRTGEPVADCEMTVERPDGARAFILANAEPLRDASGALIGAVNCIQDITKLKQTEKALRDNQAVGFIMINALPTPFYATGPDGVLAFFNEAAVNFWGRRPVIGEDRWCGALRMYDTHGNLLPHDQCPMAIAIRSGEPIIGAEAVAERPDGVRIPFAAYPSPLYDEDGKLLGAVNMLIDISERKAAEQRQKTLIDELNHRVKNTLATVQGMAMQTLRNSGDAAQAEERFVSRLLALSRTHDHLTRESWSGAELSAVLADVTAAHRGLAAPRVRLDGPLVRVPPRTALTLAMIVNELTTNAVKYGALSSEQGEATLSWSIEDGMLVCAWIESGGPPVAQPTRRGFGARLIERGVRDELGGEAVLSFEPAGVACNIKVPLTA